MIKDKNPCDTNGGEEGSAWPLGRSRKSRRDRGSGKAMQTALDAVERFGKGKGTKSD